MTTSVFKKATTAFFMALICTIAFAQARPQDRINLNTTDAALLKTDEARRIAEQVLLWQRITGGWPKNIDMVTPMSAERRAEAISGRERTDDSTIDNGATYGQMLFLARMYNATGEAIYRNAVIKGVEYIFSGQYENGGWPQFWPTMSEYQPHITYNDDAMVNTLNMLASIRDRKEPFQGDIADKSMRKRASSAFDKGIDCILATQIVVDGKPTVWCQQHDEVTLEPAAARAYELPSYCSQESAALVRLLMTLPKPDARVKAAIHGAMKWFDTYKLTGFRVERSGGVNGMPRDTKLVSDPNAQPLWGRFYDLEYTEPYVCDRDGIRRRHLEEIGRERRSGYSWYGNRPASLYPLYEAWADKYDPRHKVAISLETKGANENGTIEMFRKPIMDRSAFNVVVKPGEDIQKAIEKAPLNGTEPFKILVLNGTYNQKVVIDRPHIVLVGESRENTRIIFAEGNGNHSDMTYRGKPCGNGVISIWEEGSDCVISGFTLYNNYGTTIESTTSHQFTVFGRATRTIILNCNLWSDGNDTLALWAPGGDGMYYHADCDLRCPGVDFICPRGWCYATRMTITGGTPADAPENIRHAMIWHDGRGDESKMLVITNSTFDATNPTLLGRYHHDSKFFLTNCHMTSNILDENIQYAYTDKVLDPCPWGRRIYFYGCTREGGHSGWLNNNFEQYQKGLSYYSTVPSFVFGSRWDPEQDIRDLWSVLAY